MQPANTGQVNMTMHAKGGWYKTFLTDRNSDDDKSYADKSSVTQQKNRCRQRAGKHSTNIQ